MQGEYTKKKNAIIELYLARNLPGSRLYTCRNIVQSTRKPVRIGRRASVVQFYIYLFVEHAVVFVDIGDVAFFLVETLPREFALLVDAKNGKISESYSERKRNGCARLGEIKDRRTPY